MFYLYVKTHKETGLKYLGQTSKDPYNYIGSGKRWRNHLKVHGNNVTTEILLETNDKNELKNAGLYYSKLFNVVEDYNWANIVNESGFGGDTSNSPNYISSLKNRDFSYKKTSEYKEKVSESIKGMWIEKFNDPKFNLDEYKKMCSNRSKSMWQSRGISEEDRLKRSKKQKEYLSNPDVKIELSNKLKKSWEERSPTYEITFPDGSIITVKSFRGWCKENNYPYYKLYNSIRNNKPTKDGWQVRII